MFIIQLRRQVIYGQWGHFILTGWHSQIRSPCALREPALFFWGDKKAKSQSGLRIIPSNWEISKYSFVQFPKQTFALHVSIRYRAHCAVWKIFLYCVGDGIRSGILWLGNKNNLRNLFYLSHLCYVFLNIWVFLISIALVNNCINHLHYLFLKVLLKWLCLHKVSGAHLATEVNKLTRIK